MELEVSSFGCLFAWDSWTPLNMHPSDDGATCSDQPSTFLSHKHLLKPLLAWGWLRVGVSDASTHLSWPRHSAHYMCLMFAD